MNVQMTQAVPGLGGAAGIGGVGGGPGGINGPAGNKGPGSPDVSFQDKMDGGVGNAQGVQQTNQPQGVQDVNKTQQVNTDLSANKVNGTTKAANGQDMFGQFEKVKSDFQTFIKNRNDIESQVSSGKLSPNDPKVKESRQSEMRQLLHFQMEMQGASMKVEIASKMVEHCTSGVKTLMQTQA